MALCYVNCWLKKVFLHNKYIKTQWLVQKIFLKFDAFIIHFKKGTAETRDNSELN